jgi:hypothetical protein
MIIEVKKLIIDRNERQAGGRPEGLDEFAFIVSAGLSSS